MATSHLHTLASGQSMASDFTTDKFRILDTVSFSIQAVFTGTPTGEFTIEVSNVEEPGSSDWTTLVMDGEMLAEGSADSVMGAVQYSPFRWVRVFYDRISGTGSCSIYLTGEPLF